MAHLFLIYLPPDRPVGHRAIFFIYLRDKPANIFSLSLALY